MVKDYKELRVWQQSIELAKLVYALADRLPSKEQFGLRSQMTRATVSVASNIAEGSRRKTTKDLLNFLGMAFGSLAEVETQIIIAIEVGLLSADQCHTAFDKINQLAAGIAKLKQTLEKK